MKCPKCGCTEVDPQPGYALASSGEVEYIDYDPICKKCEHPVGDDWIGWYQSSDTSANEVSP